MRKRNDLLIHAVLIGIATLTMVPFLFVINNSLRTNTEMDHSFFGLPRSLDNMARFTWYHLRGQDDRIRLRVVPKAGTTGGVRASELPIERVGYAEAMGRLWDDLTRGYRYSWEVLRPYMVNTLLVCVATALGVVLIGSVSGYVFARYRFPGHKALFVGLLSLMMIPGILTLVPSFLLVKQLGLLNSYWVLILPYVAGGQIFAIFLFKGFFGGLPEELFESARLDGAGHVALYWHIVLPLSKQVIAVVGIMTILGTWNNFLWPYITNADATYHVVSSGLYLMGQSAVAANRATMFAAYLLSSIPLLLLFIFATRPFMRGVASGAFKA
ncbi:MAG TPA: carbohydrate ABC transporter permease [Phycisphaerae bacterium]|nr:carbohydrate ABC transporter permease [Phycisphaerae bacterium]